MRPTFAFLAALAAGALAQGVTELLTPTAASPPSCTDTRPGSFQITVQNVTKSKRDLTERQVNGKLEITLTNGILKDSIGRTGCIVANHQFQFDGPPQAGVIYTGGWSVCPNGSLAIGASAIFYQCLSGSFFNLYDKSLGGQCNQIYIEAIGGGGGGGVVSSTPIPSTTSPTSTTKGPSSASATANSTTLVATPKTSTSTHSSAANATASSTGAAGGAASASASASASVSTSASASASASGTGAGASGSSASESGASSTTVVVTTSPSGSAASTPSGSSGGASSAPAATTSGPPASTGGAVPGAVFERQGLLALAAAVFGAFAML